MNKDEVYELLIEDLTNDGEGIGHADNHMAIFVKDALPGDYVKVKIIKVKKTYAYGRLMEIIKPSEDRVDAVCENARRCGGCTIMHMSYDKQKEYKWNKVKNCLERIGGLKGIESKMEPILGMEEPFAYRNKMQFPVGLDKNGKVVMGFYAGRTHSIIDMESCAIGHPVNDFIVKHIKSWLQDRVETDKSYIYDENLHKGLVRHVLTRVGFTTGELMVCVVINGNNLAPKGNKAVEIVNQSFVEILNRAVEEYNNSVKSCGKDEMLGKSNCKAEKIVLTSVSININKDKTNKILGDTCKTIWGKEYISDYIGDIKFNISPLSFYQVNPVQTKVLYDKALEYADLSGSEIVWDMYCGIGTISLSLAKSAKKVYGVEIVPQAIEDAKNNARLNGIDNAEFYCGKAEEVVPAYMSGNMVGDTKQKLTEMSGLPEKSGVVSALSEKLGADTGNALGNTPDVIVVDPPRKGCDSVLLDTIDSMNPKRLVYVSCDPATLARDVKLLGAKGFDVEKVAVVDQFCHGGHVETVCLLSRKASV